MSALQEIAIDIEAERAARDAAVVRADKKGGGLADWFGRQSIGRKIRLFYGAILAFALVAGITIIAAFVQIGERAEGINLTHDRAIAAERLLVDLADARRHAENYMSSGDETRALAALEKLDRADMRTLDLHEKVGSSNTDAIEQLAQVETAVADMRGGIALLEPTESDIGGEARAADLSDAGAAALDAARDLASDLGTQADGMSDSGQALIGTLLVAWVALAAVLIILTLIALRYFDRNVGSALKDLAEKMTRLASGEKLNEVETSTREDEIGEMTRAMYVFHKAGVRLERLNQERSMKAKAELEEQTRLQVQQEEARLERERALKNIADQFERTVGDVVGSVASASSQLQSTATTMAASAEQSTNRTKDVATSMEEANAGATAAAAASDEFAMSIGEISRQAASSAELARKATASASEADATMSALADSADEVGHIVELIQSIAQRTNLLALNASIEAARGGEAGRGFAVVASEVKELAMQTSRATEQVADQIRAMQDTTGASVSALRSIASEVAQLESTAVSIASAVDQQSVAGQDLARSIDLAARGTEQVSGHIAEVHELSISTGSAASQVLSSATALEQQASTLRTQVDTFLAKVRAG